MFIDFNVWIYYILKISFLFCQLQLFYCELVMGTKASLLSPNSTSREKVNVYVDNKHSNACYNVSKIKRATHFYWSVKKILSSLWTYLLFLSISVIHRVKNHFPIFQILFVIKSLIIRNILFYQIKNESWKSSWIKTKISYLIPSNHTFYEKCAK